MMKNSEEQIVVFDFDKTITSIDTFTRLIVFLINQNIWRQCVAILFLPIIYSLNAFKISKPCAVSLALWIASAGLNRRYLVQLIKRYSDQRKALGIHDVMRQRAFYSIKLHLALGHRVIIVSASSRIWIRHLLGPTISSNVTIIGSRLKFRWSGLILKTWCYGKYKLYHLNQRGVSQFNLRTIYTDSVSDIVLMKHARNRCFVNVQTKLQKTLLTRGHFYFLSWAY